MQFPLDKHIVDSICYRFGLRNFHELGNASIRQLVGVVKHIEQSLGVEFVNMAIGEPGLPADMIGIEAEHQALLNGCASHYPNILGIPEVKKWGSEFVRAFINLQRPPECILPTVGSMQAAFALNMMLTQLQPGKDTILFLDPCFPVQKMQCRVIGTRVEAFDVADFRGEKLHDELERHLQTGRIAGILYSNPNNPTWSCLTDDELRTIGELATQYDAIVLEDLAYLNMDFRDSKRGTPYTAPYQPSVGHYTHNCIQLISCSKIFSYAGQRAAFVAIDPELGKRVYPALGERLKNNGELLHSFSYSFLYVLSSGVCHSVQYGMAAMLQAACEGKLRYVETTREYARRAKKIKEIMTRNGFHIVYDTDADGQAVGDGFFFTFGYKDWTGQQLVNKLIYYGVSAIALESTGAKREGMRGCASTIREDQYEQLEERLHKFNEDFG
ncbi:MAG: pyridoxal phosphate-dependent aminotransferase [Paludibacteraceae bacterium]|nr:pyridoxal phosphate-dependent aminotransferase [Paludibacteraceae bacterium]